MPDSDLKAIKAERDRFVAFAFAAADVLMETSQDGIVHFLSGATSRLRAARGRGSRLIDFFHPDDAAVVTACMDGLVAQGRMEPVHVRAMTSSGRTLHAKLGCCLLEKAPGRLFFTLSFTYSAPGGDKRFVSTATERYREALEGGLDPKLSVLVLEGLTKLKALSDPVTVQDFLTRLRAVVRAYTLGGDAADVFDDDALALVHTMDLADSALDQAVSDLAVRAFDEPLRIQTFTVDMDQGDLSSGDQARALTYAVRQFTKTDDPDRTVLSLQESCQSIIGDAIERVGELRQAIDVQDFTLVFQPIVEMVAHKVHHFEALSRFTSDRPTQELIEIAEQSGLVEDLDLVVLDLVIDTLRTGAKSGWKSVIAANVSARTLESEIYTDAVLKTIAGLGDMSNQLMLELTETVAIEDFGRLRQHLLSIQDAGCRICIDDVGAGTTSFETLISLPADFMKLDGGLFRRAPEETHARDAITAIVDMCRARDIPIIAEHIEDKDAFDLARSFGISFGQGFHYGRPIADPESFALSPLEDDAKKPHGRYRMKRGGRETWG